MIGIVVVTHSRLGEALIDAAEFIVGSRPEGVVAVSIDINQNVDKLRERVAAGIRKAGRDDGVLILTDMFGGTATNLALPFLDPDRVEIVTGVNLPMLVKLGSLRGQELPLGEIAQRLTSAAQKSIRVASEFLRSKNVRAS